MSFPFILKLLPAAQLAFEHREKAYALFKKIKAWRKGEQERKTLEISSEPATVEEEIDRLKKGLAMRDEVIAEQSDLIAKMAKDVSELSTLSEQLRRKCQRMTYFMFLVFAVLLILLLKSCTS
ncbi:hypothetical protein SAMN02745181_1522 [Rubritalea squalenifaciens DSM 18772]|uniref:t-SNARE coiled-coil homology domain-containing protein n=2 Tax=Rubritalea TaxID=361050 RepID=A0A1M6HNH2_9BACT|nr:hypothetical protein [Rubritalea squalenifaciens]SHJ23708.1 hypothetical protein SAMN02745181_1522 [Rubritalea squalenifaciens DSM 18772]